MHSLCEKILLVRTDSLQSLSVTLGLFGMVRVGMGLLWRIESGGYGGGVGHGLGHAMVILLSFLPAANEL